MESGSRIEHREEQPLKAWQPIHATEVGSNISVERLQSEKAWTPIDATDVLRISLFVRDKQPINAACPLDMADAGILISFRDVQLREALSGMAVPESLTCIQTPPLS
jgi:hypothetical protein